MGNRDRDLFQDNGQVESDFTEPYGEKRKFPAIAVCLIINMLFSMIMLEVYALLTTSK